VRAFAGAVCVLAVCSCLSSCSSPQASSKESVTPEPGPAKPPSVREVRLTGTLDAVRSYKVSVPQMIGNVNQLTLVRLIPNGSHVEQGDLIAEFDPLQQIDNARDARAKYEDLGHQVEQKRAQNRADSEKRRTDLITAEADLGKALLEVQKGPILAEILKLQNDVKARAKKVEVESIRQINDLKDSADTAALRILELQRDRQKVALDRASTNINRLKVTAPLAGMIAHQNLFRNNSMGHAQEGDQLYRGQGLVSIFDPSEMQVRCMVGEPDGPLLQPGTKATVYIDAYPDLALPAHFEFASPVAASALGSPIKTFSAVFRLDKSDPHLMPDLSAAVVIQAPQTQTAEAGGSAK
jgi:HlyD family secretion protein